MEIYLGIDGQIKEIEFLYFLVPGKQLNQHLLGVFDWYVSDHDGASSVHLNFFDIDLVLSALLKADCPFVSTQIFSHESLL